MNSVSNINLLELYVCLNALLNCFNTSQLKKSAECRAQGIGLQVLKPIHRFNLLSDVESKYQKTGESKTKLCRLTIIFDTDLSCCYTVHGRVQISFYSHAKFNSATVASYPGLSCNGKYQEINGRQWCYFKYVLFRDDMTIRTALLGGISVEPNFDKM